MNNCIEIINTNFELLGIITNYESLIYVRNLYECGTFELTINKNKANTSKLKKDNMLIVNKQDNKILLIEKVIITSEKDSKTLKVSGTCIKGLTKRRIIATNGYDRIAEATAEDIQKYYLKRHMVETYYDDIRTPERDIPFVTVAKSQNRGLRTVWQARLTNLHDEEKHISEDTGIGWEGFLDRQNKKITFDSIVGKDRTINQINNGNTHKELEMFVHKQLENYTHTNLEGERKLPYIIFSEKKKNLLDAKITDDNTNYKNVAYCGGKGENEERLIIKIGEATGFSRREIFVELNNIDDPIELQDEGKKKLGTYKNIQSVEGKIYQIPNMEYEQDWNLGDIVTLESEGVYEDKRIVQVKEIYERNNKNIEVGFGDKIPSFEEQIKKITQRTIV